MDEKEKELKLDALLNDEYSPLITVYVAAFGVFVIVILRLYDPSRLHFAGVVAVVTLLISFLAHRGRKRVIDGRISIRASGGRLIIASPFLGRLEEISVLQENLEPLEIFRRSQNTSHGVTFFYHVRLSGHDLFISEKNDKAEKVKGILQDMLDSR